MDEIMAKDGEIAELYQDTLYNLREDKESDWLMFNRIEERFNQFKDKDKMHNLPKSKFDFMGEEEDEVAASTEFSDIEVDILYK